jgi:3-methyladenine DNA glycosylase AlkD
LLREWAESAADHAVLDEFAKDVVIRTSYARELAEAWIAAPGALLNRGGWSTVASLAAFGPPELPDSWFKALLPHIERNIHTSPNRVKQAMNTALIAIGSRNGALRGPATATAGRIGKVHVDHGETYCKTPDAVSYIAKAHNRRAARASA